jgi:phage FluMu protein Com
VILWLPFLRQSYRMQIKCTFCRLLLVRFQQISFRPYFTIKSPKSDSVERLPMKRSSGSILKLSLRAYIVQPTGISQRFRRSSGIELLARQRIRLSADVKRRLSSAHRGEGRHDRQLVLCRICQLLAYRRRIGISSDGRFLFRQRRRRFQLRPAEQADGLHFGGNEIRNIRQRHRQFEWEQVLGAVRAERRLVVEQLRHLVADGIF